MYLHTDLVGRRLALKEKQVLSPADVGTVVAVYVYGSWWERDKSCVRVVVVLDSRDVMDSPVTDFRSL